MASAGRPSKFGKVDLNQVKILAEKGFTDAEMSSFFGVTEQTWNNWKKAHPSFFESLKTWKEVADQKVEHSLFERATGYSHEDTKFATFEGKITDAQPFTKHYPPDTTACIFWLKNRKQAEWRDKTEHDVSVKDCELIPPKKPNED